MGFKATTWAYGLKLPAATKAVLLALAHRADDKTGECYPGQQTVAEMTGTSTRTVARALKDLESFGVLVRQQRRRSNGYKSSDLIVLRIGSHLTESHLTESHLTESHLTHSPISHATLSDLTGHSVRYIEDEQSGEQSEDQSESEFDQFWTIYPKHQGKADAQKAYKAARKKADAASILAGTQRYALMRAGEDHSYTKLAGGWLRAERWNDDVTTTSTHRPLTRTERNLETVRHFAAQEARELGGNIITALPECPLHPGYPDTPQLPCAACARAVPEGNNF